MVDENQEKNRLHYERLYSDYPIRNILVWINELDRFLDIATTTETSWHALYQKDFRNRIRDKRVLEMGAGDCANAAIMAALGAEVYANDIADASGGIIYELNKNYEFRYPIKFIQGDFLKNELPMQYFDFIVGKGFLHHLTVPVEKAFLEETARLLKQEGEARFFEPAVNSKWLDEIRWHIPMGDRPSKFDKKRFKVWKQNDPHPERDYTSKHWESVGAVYFEGVEIIPLGTIERFSRFFPWGNSKNRFKKWSLKNEKLLPLFLNRKLARSQLIIYYNPRE